MILCGETNQQKSPSWISDISQEMSAALSQAYCGTTPTGTTEKHLLICFTRLVGTPRMIHDE